MPSDNLLITNNYAGGTLTITCDGTNKTITIPAFTDIFGDGFIVGAKFFDSKLFVGDDGTVYLNSDLTVKAS
jgi:hypothetical protein